MGVRDNFYLNFVCGWLCVVTRSETAVAKIAFIGIMSSSNATDLAKECLCLEGATFFEFHFELLVPSGTRIY